MPERYDVVIVGGAVIGSSIAYFLTHDLAFGGTVAVIERDPTYAHAATTLSAGSIRQQFSTPENIRMSQFALAFFAELETRFGAGADIGFRPGGYLMLSPVSGRAALAANCALQRAEGADVAFLEPDELSQEFPWLRTDDLGAATLGRSGEGWFDAHSLLALLRRAARQNGVDFIADEATGVERERSRVEAVRLADGSRIACGMLVNAAGPQAGDLAALADVVLPVEPRKRCVFVVACRAALPAMPLVVDVSGVWVRPEGHVHICGVPPREDPRADDFALDYPLFDEILWPALAHRIPAMETLKLTRAWAGHYEFNTFDQNAIVGPHPELANFIFANGFSGHGLQHAPAVGRAVAELIVHGHYVSLDLGVFAYDRIAAEKPVREENVI